MNLAKHGSSHKPPANQAKKQRLSISDNMLVYWIKEHVKGATTYKVQHILRDVTGKEVSDSILSRCYKTEGLSYKDVDHQHEHQDPEDRAAFWLNTPDHLTRPGVHLVAADDIVDIDEAGVYSGDAQVNKDHSKKGTKCSKQGKKLRSGVRNTFAVAFDTTNAVISSSIFPEGTTNEKF